MGNYKLILGTPFPSSTILGALGLLSTPGIGLCGIAEDMISSCNFLSMSKTITVPSGRFSEKFLQKQYPPNRQKQLWAFWLIWRVQILQHIAE